MALLEMGFNDKNLSKIAVLFTKKTKWNGFCFS